MQTMKVTIQLIIITICVTIIGGCNTYRWWRDSYMGRAILEPNLVYERVERDNYGNPILPKGATPLTSKKEALKYD